MRQFVILCQCWQRGIFKGAQSANADRTDFDCAASSSAPLKCAFREHNAVGQGFLSHKNPCAGVGARAPTNQFQDGILIKPSWPGVRGLEAPGNQGCRGRPAKPLQDGILPCAWGLRGRHSPLKPRCGDPYPHKKRAEPPVLGLRS